MLDSLDALCVWLAACLMLGGRNEDLKLCNLLCKRLLEEDVATKMLR